MCDMVLCGGVTCDTQGELCENMGISADRLVVLHGLVPCLESCLCVVDIEATAAENGYTAKLYYDQVADWVLTPNVELTGPL